MPKAKTKTTKKTTAPKTATRTKAMPIVPLLHDGPFEAFATGTDRLLARGAFKAGLRDGAWAGGSRDGVHGWLDTYVAGIQDGLSREIIAGRGKDGLCGEGREVAAGKRVGLWTLYHDDGTVTTHDYDAPEPGPSHGEVTETWPDGRVKRTCTFVRGVKNGDETRYFENGKPAFQGTWLFDLPVGEHVEWDDDGGETRTTYVAGLPEQVAADTKALERTRKLYDKATCVRSSDVRKGLETCRAANDDAFSLADAWMLHMWRTLHVNISNDDTWEMLANVAPLITGKEVITILREIDFESGWGWPLPKWHGELDRLVMRVYARDPAPIDAAWEKLKEPAKSGVAFVRARFGKPVGKTLEQQLEAVASNRQSIGTVWWPLDEAGPREVALGIKTALPPEAAQLRALFGTDDAWRTALMKVLGKDDVSREATTHRLWIETATAGELVEHASDLATDDWETIVTQWRRDDATGLTTIALDLEQAGDARDQLVALAVIAHAAEGTQPPEALIDRLALPASNLWFRSAEGDVRLAVATRSNAPDRNAVFHRALATLPQDRICRVVERVMATDGYDRLRVGQYLYLVEDVALVERYLDQLVAAKTTRIDWMTGIGEAGARFLPLLIARLTKQKKVKVKRILSAAINIALARIASEGPFDAELDRYIDLTLETETGFGGYLDQILCALPRERAEACLLAGFQTAFFAAFRRISACGSEPVLRAAFGGLLAQPKVQRELDRTIVPTIEALPDAANWWQWLHDSGATGRIHEECERQLRIGKFAD